MILCTEKQERQLSQISITKKQVDIPKTIHILMDMVGIRTKFSKQQTFPHNIEIDLTQIKNSTDLSM
jgi:hypothetical protein